MPTFTDIRIVSALSNSLSRGTFAEFMERETEYIWDGSLEGKIALMRIYEEKVKSEKWKIGSHRSDEGRIQYSRSLDHLQAQDDGSSQVDIYELESRLIPILADMEMTWVRLDTVKLAKIWGEISTKIRSLETEIYEITGEFLNLSSPKQVAELLFGKLGIKPTKKNKTGYSVDTEVLEEIAKDYGIARLIIEHRSLSKLQSTYVESLLRLVDQRTDRVHTTYSQIGAATGRMSSNDPNLQNIPTGIGYASDIKSCFIPSEGNVFLVADYSQIEIRVLAWLAQDVALLDAFEKWEDIHTRTAYFLFWSRPSLQRGIPEGEGDFASENTEQNPQSSAPFQTAPLQKELITPDQRRIAKTVNFWVIYGITGFGLAKTLGTPPWEAQQYIDAFYVRYPWVKTYYEQILEEGREKWYVETAFGRRRYIPGLRDANKMVRAGSEREAINMPIQWTAADMLKYAMLDIDAKVRDKKLRWKMILQVHDELVFDIPIDEADIWKEIVHESMEGVLENRKSKFDIRDSVGITEWRMTNHESRLPPIRVDMHTGENWVVAKG